MQRGTATRVKAVGKPIAGKTGTTNDEKDAWFVGFSPDLVVGVFVGFDQPRPMGRGMTGGHVAAPIFVEFMKAALADQPPKEFQAPPGINFIPVDRRTGLRAQPGDPDTILEAFKPGSEPPSGYSIIGYQSSMGVPTQMAWPQDNPYREQPSPPSLFGRSQQQYQEPQGEPMAGGQYRMLPNGVIIKVQ